MLYDKEKREIALDKELNILDKFTIDFLRIIENHVKYVIVSGYVSIVLGRTRSSEDIDLLIEKMDKSKFFSIFENLISNGYECANSSDPEEAYEMLSEHAIRFYEIGKPIPNMEFKMISQEIQQFALDNRVSLKLGEETLYISPLELQIAYKLSLVAEGDIEEISSDKDFEDAKHIYELFKDELNEDELIRFVKMLKVEKWFELLKK